MKVPISKEKRGNGGIPWVACEPFVENSRAALIHRVRHVTTHQINDKYRPHIAVKCWCGNSMTGTKKFTFISAPGTDDVLCARCEVIATKVGLPSAESIAGRHVHVGGVVVVKHCRHQKTTIDEPNPIEKTN